jgi:hypothetical protein
VAIRPTDLQSSIFTSVQTGLLTQKAEEGPRQAQLAAQASFAAQVTKREETIAETSQAEGNRVNANPDRQGETPEKRQRRRHTAGEPFEEVVDEAAGLGEPEHLIDFSA